MARGHHGRLPRPRGGATGEHPVGQGQVAAVVALQSPRRVAALHQSAGHDLRRGRNRPGQLHPDAGRHGQSRLSVQLRAAVPPGPPLRGDHGVRLGALLRDLWHRGGVRLLPGAAPATTPDAEPAALPRAAGDDDRQRASHRPALTAEHGMAGLDDVAAGRQQGRRGRGDPAVDRQHPGHGLQSHLRPQPTGEHLAARGAARLLQLYPEGPRRVLPAAAHCQRARPFRPAPP